MEAIKKQGTWGTHRSQIGNHCPPGLDVGGWLWFKLTG